MGAEIIASGGTFDDWASPTVRVVVRVSEEFLIAHRAYAKQSTPLPASLEPAALVAAALRLYAAEAAYTERFETLCAWEVVAEHGWRYPHLESPADGDTGEDAF